MSSIGELFGFPGEENQTPIDSGTLNSEIDRIMADRPIPGAPDGYVSPRSPQAPQGDGVGVAGGPGPAAPGAMAPAAPPPPFAWPQGPASEYPQQPPPAVPPAPYPAAPAPAAPPPAPAPAMPPAAPPAPADPWSQLNDLQRMEALQIVAALQDPDRAAGIRRAYIGAPEPIGGAPTAPPPPAPPFAIGMPPAPAPQLPVETPLPEGLEEGTPEAQMFRTQQEQARQLQEIREGVQARDRQTEDDLTRQAATTAVTAFTQRYGQQLSQPEIDWICQMAGHQRLPDAFRNSNPNLSREEAFTQALEFQLRSTDQLFTKIVAGATPAPPTTPPAPPAPTVYPGQTPQADARHRYLTALSSAASPSGEAPVRTPLQHRADGKLDEPSRMELVRQMTSGGAMGELMGPN